LIVNLLPRSLGHNAGERSAVRNSCRPSVHQYCKSSTAQGNSGTVSTVRRRGPDPVVPFGPPHGDGAVVAEARHARVGPEVGQVQHDQFAAPKSVGIPDLERDRVTQCGQPALGAGLVLFVDEVVDDVEEVLQLGFGEGSPPGRHGIVGAVSSVFHSKQI
jgi:hypothetical protein